MRPTKRGHNDPATALGERGTASVEAVVLLPILMLAWAGVYYLHGLASTHQRMTDSARACAWAHALGGCQGGLDGECAGRTAGTVHEPQNGGLAEQTSRGELDDFTKELGFLGDVLEGFLGASLVVTRAAHTQALADPDETVRVDASIVVPCNPEPPRSVDEFLGDIFGLGGV